MRQALAEMATHARPDELRDEHRAEWLAVIQNRQAGKVLATQASSTFNAFVSALASHELRANAEIESHGVLSGITYFRIADQSLTVAAHPGAKDLMSLMCCGVGDFAGHLHVISSTPSEHFLRCALSRVLLPRFPGAVFRQPLVTANTLTMIGEPGELTDYCGTKDEDELLELNEDAEHERSSGSVEWSVASSKEKAEVFMANVQAIQEEGRGGMSIFIGSTVDDIPAMVAADIGLIVNLKSASTSHHQFLLHTKY